jgi:hypothetical protein
MKKQKKGEKKDWFADKLERDNLKALERIRNELFPEIGKELAALKKRTKKSNIRKK